MVKVLQKLLSGTGKRWEKGLDAPLNISTPPSVLTVVCSTEEAGNSGERDGFRKATPGTWVESSG